MVIAAGRGSDDRLGRTRAERRPRRRRPPGRRPGGVRPAPRRARPTSAPSTLPAARAGAARAFRTGAPARRLGGRADGLRHGDRGVLETLFALSNGFLGIRGSTDEGGPGSAPGAYVAGLFDGTTAGQEDLVVIADWAATEITVGGRALRPWEWHILEHTRRLDLRALRLRAHAPLCRPRRPHAAAQVGADREPRRPAHRRRPAGARRRGRPRGEGPGRRRLRTHEAHGPLPHVEIGRHGQRRRRSPSSTAGRPGNRVAVDHALAVSASARDSALAAEHVTGEDLCGRAVECDLAAGEELRVDRFVAVYTEREVALPGPSAGPRRPVGPDAPASTGFSSPSSRVGPGLGCRRCRDRRGPGRPGRRALRRGRADRRRSDRRQPLLDRGEGAHGRRLQGPRLLGHGHLPAPVLRRREAGDRAPDRRVPRPHPRRRPPERRERRASAARGTPGRARPRART